MDIEPKYTFVPLSVDENIIAGGINDKGMRQLCEKWGLNLGIQKYLFNEPFHRYHKYQLAEAFFKDENVSKTLKIYQGGSCMPRGIAASSVTIEQVPCSVLSMSFFDKLRNPENNVADSGGRIRKRWHTDIDGIPVFDNLRGMLLDHQSPEYRLYSEAERRQFIFRIFRTLVLGGELCQYEDELEPYLACAKAFYKRLVSVEKTPESQDLSVSTMVLEVIAKDENGVSYFPRDAERGDPRNAAFFLIDGNARAVTTMLHQSSSYIAHDALAQRSTEGESQRWQ